MSPAAGRCACGCHGRVVQKHHVVYVQELRRAGGDPRDPRGMVGLALRCHEAHHTRSRVLPLHVLPDAAFEFAAEVLGPGAAYEYLRRRYAGGDRRLDALLEAFEGEGRAA